MHLRSTRTFEKALVLVLACGSCGPSLAQPSVTTSGTLTCTVADVPNSSKAVADLSCNFKSQSGPVSDYTGQAGTRTGGFPPAKFVFVWTVAAVEAGSKEALLDGTFTAEKGREGPPVLIGGKDGGIRLEPAAGGQGQVPGPAEITTLTLKLSATKT